MVARSRSTPASKPNVTVDFAALYDSHGEYVARRLAGSFEQEQIDLEVRYFKLPHLTALLPASVQLASVLEIGCATGELISAFPVAPGGLRLGVDISPGNIEAARARFPDVSFSVGDFRDLSLPHVDCVVMSDVLEHVEDDVGFLRDAARFGRLTLVNLPLEDNWLNRNRRYGSDDVSGHLRKYGIREGLALFSRAGLDMVAWRRVWVHETETDSLRRGVRRRHLGHGYAGTAPVRLAKATLNACARSVRPFGRRLFASNLFVLVNSGGRTR